MRPLLFAFGLSGCFAGQLDSGMRPAVLPSMTAVPTDPEQRNGINDQSQQVAGPEQRKGMSKRARKVETTAAWAAAIVGVAFSKSDNVLLGGAGTVEENQLFEKTPEKRPMRAKTSHTDPEGSEPPAGEDTAGDLVPWIKLKPTAPSN